MRDAFAIASTHRVDTRAYEHPPVGKGELLIRSDLIRDGDWAIVRTETWLTGRRPPATPRTP